MTSSAVITNPKTAAISPGDALGRGLLILGMTVIIYFFIIAGRVSSWSAWLYGAFLLYLFVRMVNSGKISRYRRIFQVSFAVLFCISFVGQLLDERGSMAITDESIVDSVLPFCQIVIPQALLPLLMTGKVIFPARLTDHFASIGMMLVIWIAATLTIGRGWCSWACFFGGWEDGFSRLGKKKPLKLLSRHRDIRAFQFAFLIFIALMSLMLMATVFCEWFCPFKVVTEYWPVLDVRSLIAGVLFIGIFVAAVGILPALSGKRTQCSGICPFGSFQSLCGKLSPYRIVIDTARCTGCMACAKACPFCAIDENTITAKKGQAELTCALCGECVGKCPVKAIRWAFVFDKQPKPAALSAAASVAAPATVPAALQAALAKTGRELAQFARTVLNPERVFVFTAFTFSVVISGRFSVDALNRIASLLLASLRVGG